MNPCCFLVLAALVQASHSFNLGISQLSDPRSRPNYCKIGFGTSVSFLLAKRGATIGGTLKPSDRVSSSKIFEEVIINKDLKEINTLVIGDAFKVPSPSIFLSKQDERSYFRRICLSKSHTTKAGECKGISRN